MKNIAYLSCISLIFTACAPTASQISYKTERDQQAPGNTNNNDNTLGNSNQQATGNAPQELHLTWDAPAPDENVTSFRFYGAQSADGEYKLFYEVDVENVKGMQEGLPELTMDISGNIILEQLDVGTMCFYMTAVNAAGESDGSGKLCFQ